MQASDSSLGPYLRAEREQQGIDLKDIASLTKIQPKFIEALEADDYDQLPKGPFIIGFLRSYAQCLSLDPDEVVAYFQTHHGKPAHSSPTPQPQRPAQQRPSSIPRVSWQRGVILSVGLAALVLILFYGLQSGPSEQQIAQERSDTTAVDKPPAARQTIATPAAITPLLEPQEATASHAITPPTLSPSTTLPSTTLPTPATSPPTPSTDTDPIATDVPQEDAAPPPPPIPTPLVLRVQALEETWMRLDIDDDTRQEALIKAGKSIEWKASKQFSLTIGNVKGARVSLNDQELDLPATRSNVLRDYVLTRALLNPRRTD